MSNYILDNRLVDERYAVAFVKLNKVTEPMTFTELRAMGVLTGSQSVCRDSLRILWVRGLITRGARRVGDKKVPSQTFMRREPPVTQEEYRQHFAEELWDCFNG